MLSSERISPEIHLPMFVFIKQEADPEHAVAWGECVRKICNALPGINSVAYLSKSKYDTCGSVLPRPY